MAVDNNTIIGDFLLRNTNDAQQLGLTSAMTGLSRNMQSIFDPINGDIYNHFVDWLVKVPAMQYTRAQSFENGLKAFVKKVTYGGSVWENQVGWVQERSFRKRRFEASTKLISPKARKRTISKTDRAFSRLRSTATTCARRLTTSTGLTP